MSHHKKYYHPDSDELEPMDPARSKVHHGHHSGDDHKIPDFINHFREHPSHKTRSPIEANFLIHLLQRFRQSNRWFRVIVITVLSGGLLILIITISTLLPLLSGFIDYLGKIGIQGVVDKVVKLIGG